MTQWVNTIGELDTMTQWVNTIGELDTMTQWLQHGAIVKAT